MAMNTFGLEQKDLHWKPRTAAYLLEMETQLSMEIQVIIQRATQNN